MSKHAIQLLDNRLGELVDAVLHDKLPADTLLAVEKAWFPVRMQAVARLIQTQGPAAAPEHWHWNWGLKASRLQFLAYRCMGIECDGQIQNLMMVSTVGHAARIAPDVGKPLLYVDYVESAPWNVRPLTSKPIYGGIGVQIMLAAARSSAREGFHGRVGLNALPQAERFYRTVCGMTDLGPDPDAHNLRYFEFTRDQTRAFIQKGGN